MTGAVAFLLLVATSACGGTTGQPVGSQPVLSAAPQQPSVSPTLANSGSAASSVSAAAPAARSSEPPSPVAPATSPSAGLLASAAALPECRSGNPLTNVYHPQRLEVVSGCQTVTGTVRIVRHEGDADLHIDLDVDAPFAALVNAVNRAQQHGYLVLEIVPADAPGCPSPAPRPGYDYGACTQAALPTPAVGQHISATGPYVLDHDHGGWAEIHPVWSWSAAPAGAQPALATTPPPLQLPASPSAAAASTAAVAAGDGHTYYASSYRTARDIYCDTDPGWRRLSPRYLQSFPSLEAAQAAHPGYTLHQAC